MFLVIGVFIPGTPFSRIPIIGYGLIPVKQKSFAYAQEDFATKARRHQGNRFYKESKKTGIIILVSWSPYKEFFVSWCLCGDLVLQES